MEIRITKGFREVIINQLERAGVIKYEVWDSAHPHGTAWRAQSWIYEKDDVLLIFKGML